MARRWNFLSRTSDLYVGKSTILKIFLLVGVLMVSVVFIWYTFSVIRQLQMDTRAEVERYVKLWQLVANSPTSGGGELQFVFNEIIAKATFPIIVLDENKEPIHWRNIHGIPPEDTSAATRAILKTEAASMNGINGEYPLYFAGTHVNYFLYGDSELIDRLKTMPFIQIGIVLAFMIVGVIGFQNIRRSEERHIWVGMAKETAHQLGTPLSSLMGWLEVLGNECSARGLDGRHETLAGTLDNMRVDITRLQRVTNRFSMIGSIPELKPAGVNELVTEVCDYYRRRLPFHGEGIRINFSGGTVPAASLNPELLGWALENLTKNAIEAVDAKAGRIDVKTLCSEDGRYVEIEIADNGKGISAAAARKIFRPGFTTKKRGWGLGLTLVKRIVEEYHGGRVWLVRSRPGETVFHVELPITRNENKG